MRPAGMAKASDRVEQLSVLKRERERERIQTRAEELIHEKFERMARFGNVRGKGMTCRICTRSAGRYRLFDGDEESESVRDGIELEPERHVVESFKLNLGVKTTNIDWDPDLSLIRFQDKTKP